MESHRSWSLMWLWVGLCALVSATVTGLGLGAAPALAATGSGVISSSPPPVIALSSTTAGAAPDLNLSLAFQYGAGDTLDSLTVMLPAGMWVAPAAVPATCSSAELASHTCPVASELGSGTAGFSLSGGLLSLLSGAGAQTATVSLYAMPATASAGPDELLAIGAVITDAGLGITDTLTGAATVVDGSTTPQVFLTLDGLPESASGGLLSGLTALQLNVLQLKFDGAAASSSGGADAGSAFIHLPTACAPANVTVDAVTYAGAHGGAVQSITPTGCPLALAPSLSESAARDNQDSGTSFVSTLQIPPGDGALGALTLKIPSSLIGPSAKYSSVNCSAAAPFSGCPAVGTITATTPLNASPLTGTVYLTGTVNDLGLGVSFPAPYALSFTGHLTLGSPYVLSFTGLPDIPLTGLSLAFPAGQQAAFVAVCSTATTGRVTGSATGLGGGGAHPLSAPLSVTGCPAAVKRSLAFAFRLSSGAHTGPLKELKLRLPKGLSFSAAGLRRALQVSGARYSFKLEHGVLVLTLRHAAKSVVIRVGAAGVSVGATAPDSPHLGVTVTDKDGKATHLDFTLGLQR